MQTTTSTAVASQSAALALPNLQALGLTEADGSAIAALAGQLDASRQDSIYTFGRDVAKHTATHTDSMLEQVKSSDLEGLGEKLSTIVTAAQSLNLHALADHRSKVPLIGGFIDKLRLNKDEFMQRFKSVKEQIDGLVAEVGVMQQGLAARITTLDANFASVKEEHHVLGMHVAAGQLALEQLQVDITQMQAQADAGQLTMLQAQDLQDRTAAVGMIDKRVADLRVLQHSAMQTLPMIRMVQTNNHMLIEKFHTVKELTLPAWKRQFMLSLSLNEQKNAVQLAQTIDDATNQFLKENAALLKQNTVSTAKANQRLVIDVETLQQVQDTLLATVQEVIQINKDGVAQRKGVSSQLAAMRSQLQIQLSKTN